MKERARLAKVPLPDTDSEEEEEEKRKELAAKTKIAYPSSVGEFHTVLADAKLAGRTVIADFGRYTVGTS